MNNEEYFKEIEEHLKKLKEKEAENKRNVLVHLMKALSYTDCGVVDMQYDQEKEIVTVTFLSGAKRIANVKVDNSAAMIYDIFKQIEWLR